MAADRPHDQRRRRVAATRLTARSVHGDGGAQQDQRQAGDFPASHITDDQNTFITLDPDKSGLIATGNGQSSNCPGENCNRIEVEREIGKYPLFAWAGEGDRFTGLGRWIFDCGHPDPAPTGKCSSSSSTACSVDADCPSGGTCTSPAPNFQFRAELHPPQAIAVMRNKSIGKTPATRADVYVSADGGGASDRCEVTHLASIGDVLTNKKCFTNTCSKTTSQTCRIDADCPKKETCTKLDPSASVLDVNASDFEFDMLLPPKPAGANRCEDQDHQEQAAEGKCVTQSADHHQEPQR